MAQRRTTRKRTKTELNLRSVQMDKPRRKLARNDNDETRYSGLTFRAARELKQRTADLEWQIRFAKMKLRTWHNPDNWEWDGLDALLKRAEAELREIA